MSELDLGGYLMPHERPYWMKHARTTEEQEDDQRRAEEYDTKAEAETKALHATIADHAIEARLGASPQDILAAKQAAAMASDEAGQSRDSWGEYGSRERPALLIGWKEVPPKIPGGQASRGEYAAEELLQRARQSSEAVRSGRLGEMFTRYRQQQAGRRDEIRRARYRENLAELQDLVDADAVRNLGGLPGADRERGYITRVTSGPRRFIDDWD